MLIKETLIVLEELDRLLTEKESVFDYSVIQGGKKQSEEEVKEAILNNLLSFFRGFKYVRDIKILGERLQFFIPEDKLDWFEKWRGKSKAIQNGNLHLFSYNADGGYLIEIQ